MKPWNADRLYIVSRSHARCLAVSSHSRSTPVTRIARFLGLVGINPYSYVMRAPQLLSAVAFASSVPVRSTTTSSATVTMTPLPARCDCCLRLNLARDTCALIRSPNFLQARNMMERRRGLCIPRHRPTSGARSMSGTSWIRRGGTIPLGGNRRTRRFALGMGSVSQQDIMKEFTSAAAAEESLSREHAKKDSEASPAEDVTNRGEETWVEGAADRTMNVKPAQSTDDARPTGYR